MVQAACIAQSQQKLTEQSEDDDLSTRKVKNTTQTIPETDSDDSDDEPLTQVLDCLHFVKNYNITLIFAAHFESLLKIFHVVIPGTQ